MRKGLADGGPATGPMVEFCFLVESGALEFQAVLLAESIRRFGGGLAGTVLTAISPRSSRRPAPSTVDRLQTLGVEYIELDLVSPVPDYGPSFKVFALGWLSRRPGLPVLVQLDSDTVFLAEPDLDIEGYGLAARPVDVVGACTSSPADANEAVWRTMCAACLVDFEALPFVATTIGGTLVRASFNGGLVAAPRETFALVEEQFRRILRAGARPYAGIGGLRSGAAFVPPSGAEWWGTGQAAISLALALQNLPARILPPSHNIPVHVHSQLEPASEDAVHLHYHWIFEDMREYGPALRSQTIEPRAARWLSEQLPLPRA
jgi:hypothetical protein